MPPPAEGLASRLFLGPALRTQPDRRLVRLVREGYEVAFEEIVRRYDRPLTRYAASIVGGRSEDVTQDAFSKALQALCRDDAEIELRPWLFRIVRNTALNDLRDSPPSPDVLAEAIVGGRNPAEELERREELVDLMRRLQALPEAQRAAIVMRELEGLSHEEIAAALGMTGGAARQAIYRARRTLRDGLGMLVPLPLVQAMLATASTPGAAETAAGAAGAGVGAGIALKATAATVLVAGAVGTGVALKHDGRNSEAEAAPVQASRAPGGDRGGGDHGRHGEGELGDDHGGERGSGSDGGHRGEREPGDDHGGHSGPSGGGGGSPEEGLDQSGPSHESSRSGPGSGSGEDGSGSSHGGSGTSGGSGSEGSGGSNSGPGSGDDVPEEIAPPEASDDSVESQSGHSGDSGGDDGLSG
jgi:RNA polymerase sigma factor (sigma-70 family)